ncbi:MAG: hypothetical protein IJL55_02235 [Lachnospiraceae bacterium]|nr:hypothetical protein [Lachnospiraceae bacterium]
MIKINKTVEQSFYIPAILLGLVLFTVVASIVFTNVRYVKFSMVADVDGKPVDDVYVSNYSKSAVPGEGQISMREENLANPYRVVTEKLLRLSMMVTEMFLMLLSENKRCSKKLG